MITIYQTVLGRQFAKTSQEVAEWAVEQILLGNPTVVPVQGNAVLYKIDPAVSTDKVTLLPHPVKITVKDKTLFLVDTRQYEKPDGTTRNSREIQPIYERAALVAAFEQDVQLYRPILPGLTAVFLDWVVGAVRTSTAASIAEIEALKVFLAAGYYFIGFEADYLKHLTVDDYQAITLRLLTRDMRMAPNFVNEIITSELFVEACENTRTAHFSELNNWLRLASKYINNPAIRLDTASLLVLLVNTSWMGGARQELAGVALEYPPYLAWMVGQALSMGIYRNTRIGKAVDNAKRGKANVTGISGWLKEILHDYQL